MSTEVNVGRDDESSRRNVLNRRLEEVAWGVFLIMLGGIWLAPNDIVPAGAWLVGAGLIMLALNTIRYLKGLRVNWLTVVLGAVALAAGIGDALRIDLPIFAILLIAIGALIVVRPWFAKHAT